MTFEERFDFWLAKKVAFLLNRGFSISQAKTMLELLYSDFSDCIDDENVLESIQKKIERTLQIFTMGENNDKAN